MLVLPETIVKINGGLQIFKECLEKTKSWKNQLHVLYAYTCEFIYFFGC